MIIFCDDCGKTFTAEVAYEYRCNDCIKANGAEDK